jgi:succinoglycan biosynthesis transport protein ExoP
MFVKQNVDYLPNGHFENMPTSDRVAQLKKLQRQKWQVLTGTFLFIFILANIFIWSRPSLYQSQAIMQFMAANPLDDKNPEFLQQYLEVNQQRLTSEGFLSALSENLHANYQIDHSYLDLINMLSVTASESGNVVIIEAQGQNKEQLKPIVDSLVNSYIKNIMSENQTTNSDEVSIFKERLLNLESKIAEQRTTVENYAADNQIISLVRDENQILSKIKGLSTNFDIAEAEKNQAIANLESLNRAFQSSEVIINPEDKTSINEARSTLQLLSEELKALNDQYTPEYLARDPLIMAKQQAKAGLENNIEQQISDSQLAYLQKSQRDLETSNKKVSLINTQLVEQRQLAQTFNQQLEQYKRLSSELEDLQLQKQTLKAQLVELELTKPFEVKISVLEPASRADFPIGPNYWRDTFFALLLSSGLALLALFIFAYIVRPTTEKNDSPNIVVVPQYNSADPHFLTEQRYKLEQQKAAEPILGLANSVSLRILTINECQALYTAANNQGKILMGLLFCGVSIDEIENIKNSDFATSFTQLHMGGQFNRQLNIPQEFAKLLATQCKSHQDHNTSLWSGTMKESDLNELIINSAYDAELELPDLISLGVVRHTYIGYLVDQGVRLNELELCCGYIAPATLSHFRQAKKLAKTTPLEQVQTSYPFLAS